MSWRDIFNVSRPAILSSAFPAGGSDPSPSSTVTQGTFVTPQSITTFAGASGLITLIWTVAVSIDPAQSNSTLVPAISSLVIGGILFLISESDPKRGPLTLRDYLIDGLVALANVPVLYMAALGTRHLLQIH